MGLNPSTRRCGTAPSLFHTFVSLHRTLSPSLHFALLCHTFASLLLTFASLRSLRHLYFYYKSCTQTTFLLCRAFRNTTRHNAPQHHATYPQNGRKVVQNGVNKCSKKVGSRHVLASWPPRPAQVPPKLPFWLALAPVSLSLAP